MGNRTPKLVLPVANGSSAHSANINASIILMPDGLNIPRRGSGKLVKAFASLHAEGWVHVF